MDKKKKTSCWHQSAGINATTSNHRTADYFHTPVIPSYHITHTVHHLCTLCTTWCSHHHASLRFTERVGFLTIVASCRSAKVNDWTHRTTGTFFSSVFCKKIFKAICRSSTKPRSVQSSGYGCPEPAFLFLLSELWISPASSEVHFGVHYPCTVAPKYNSMAKYKAQMQITERSNINFSQKR